MSELAAINQFGAEGWKQIRRLAENRDLYFPKRTSSALILAKSSAKGSPDVVIQLVDEYLQLEEQFLEIDLGLAAQHALGIEAAHRLFTSKLLTTNNSKRQEWLAHWLTRWEERDPKLRKK